MGISLVLHDPAGIQLIDWTGLDKLMLSNSNAKVAHLYKMTKESIGRTVQVGTLNNSLKSIFSWEKHADLFNERVTRIPMDNI
jgi:hypothetical protein